MRGFLIWFPIIIVVLYFGVAPATIINVPADFSTIQMAIDSSFDGDTVLVQPDTHIENINFNGHNIVLGSLFLTTGDTSYISTTIIYGDLSGSVVTFEGGEDSTSVITGFTIQNGFGSGTHSFWSGGGVTCINSSPIIRYNIISENTANVYGGGIYCKSSSPAISNNTISNNVVTISAEGFGGGGISCRDGSAPNISGNIISGNFGGGIYSENDSVFLISDNIIYGNASGEGGGIYCKGSSPIITDNNISENNAAFYGGGIYCENNSPVISFNNIHENIADYNGGGLYCFAGSSPTISENVIYRNIATGDGGGSTDGRGGGIYCLGGCSPDIVNNTIFENTANLDGGGIGCSANSSPTISDNIIIDNFAGEDGAGIFCYSNSYPTISENIISGNTANHHSGGIHCRSDGSPTIINNTITRNNAINYAGGIGIFNSFPVITNTIIWENSAGAWANLHIWYSTPIITYCDIPGGWPDEGNIDLDPLFRDPANGDFHLMSIACGDSVDSPCIDVGDPNILDSLLDCSWGLGGLRSDMGAYGGGDSTLQAIDDYQSPLPTRPSLLQNHPNPFNISTTIEYRMLEAEHVRITVYNLLGRRIETLVDEKKRAGQHQVVWDASGHSSGTYFYRLEAGDYSETKRMVLLK